MRLNSEAVRRCLTAFGSESHDDQDNMRVLRTTGVPISKRNLEASLTTIRSGSNMSIGAPSIPNVTWDDVGGLASVKKDILETVQMPLQNPALFAQGLKRRSGALKKL